MRLSTEMSVVLCEVMPAERVPVHDRRRRFLIDEDMLRRIGSSSFERYAVVLGQPLLPDLFS